MKNIQRIVSVVCVFVLILTFAMAEPVRIGALKGPTSMGLVNMMSECDPNAYVFTLAGSADELTPAFLKGELDILAVPANLGAVLYNKTEGNVRMLSIEALGVLYIVEKGDVTIASIEDLRGRTVFAAGKGSTPEYMLRYILASAGIEDEVTIEWKSEASETVAAMSAQDNAVAMLPQPYTTVALGKLENTRIALDLTEEWQRLDPGSAPVTAAIIASPALGDDVIGAFLTDCAASVQSANESIDETAALCEEYGIVASAAIAMQALPLCNIVCITGDEMKTMAGHYFGILFEYDAASVGGALPGDDFYYVP